MLITSKYASPTTLTAQKMKFSIKNSAEKWFVKTTDFDASGHFILPGCRDRHCVKNVQMRNFFHMEDNETYTSLF